jgi:hypothetical protein
MESSDPKSRAYALLAHLFEGDHLAVEVASGRVYEAVPRNVHLWRGPKDSVDGAVQLHDGSADITIRFSEITRVEANGSSD